MRERHVSLGDICFAWEKMESGNTDGGEIAKKKVDTSNFTAPDVFGKQSEQTEEDLAEKAV